MLRNKSTIQKIAFIYSMGFFVVVIVSLMPGATNEQGKLFGLYHIDPIDHFLHSFSGLWGIYAGLKSEASVRFYFRTFGTIYFLDGLAGLLTGYNFLNLHFLTNEPAVEISKRLAVNAPHMIIGGIAMIFGFIMHNSFLKVRAKRNRF